MNINLHIERLILDGLPITRQQGPHVQAAVEAELTRLLSCSPRRPRREHKRRRGRRLERRWSIQAR